MNTFENFKQELSNYLDVIIQEKINLISYANKNNILIATPTGGIDKGWKGNAIEHLLNITKNNSSTSDYGFLEVKTVPVKNTNGSYKVQETTCLSVIDTNNLLKQQFDASDLFQKIQKTIFILINTDDPNNPHICNYLFLDLNENTKLKNLFKDDYNSLVSHVYDNLELDQPLDYHFSGTIGKYLQPRPKNGKKGNYTWAFYMKTNAWKVILEQGSQSKLKIR